MGLCWNLASLSLLAAAASIVLQWKNQVDIEEFYRGKRVIVTGASKGIGRSLALQLAQFGAKVVIAARSEQQLAEVEEACLQWSGQVVSIVADLSREEDCRAIVDKARAEFGGLDILILNAAFSPTPQLFEQYDQPAKLAHDVLNVNLFASVHMVQMSLAMLRESKGSIVPVSSATGFFGTPKVSFYAASKHGIHGFFTSLYQEFALTGTPVSITIMPLPFVLTDTAVENWKPRSFFHGITPEDCASRMLHGIPGQRLFYFVDWSTRFTSYAIALCPELVSWAVRHYLVVMSQLFQS